MPLDDSVVQFVIGSFNRERQRIAKVLAKFDVDERIIVGILDQSQDANVFRADGPSVHLNDDQTKRDKG